MFPTIISTKGLLLVNNLQLHGAIYRPDSFVLMPHHCVNLKAIRYESTNLNRIVAHKSHRVIVALGKVTCCKSYELAPFVYESRTELSNKFHVPIFRKLFSLFSEDFSFDIRHLFERDVY